MTHHPARPPRRRSLGAVVVTALAALLPACVADGENGGQQLTVMTRNVYLGTSLADVFGLTSLPEVVAAVGRNWANVRATDFRTRAGALANEIAQARPDVIGLQEVTLWREQSPGDLLTDPGPNATRVVLDHLATLLDELAARGIPYTAVAASTNADIEAPRPGLTGLIDLRITDRDVIVVRAELAERFANPRDGHYAAVLHLPLADGTVPNTRGWTTVDYLHDEDTTVRILDTHLEVPSSGALQERQGAEVLEVIAASPYPVIALGDFNSPADGSATDTYWRLTAELDDAWTRVRPADPGPTCCQSELLTLVKGRERTRVDLVLTPADWPVTQVRRTGSEPFRISPAPLWASDHLGVVARLTIPG